MKSLLTKKLAIPVAALVVLGGAAGAVAATQGSGAPSAQAYINDLAGRLNVTPSTLSTAMKAALDDQIDAAVTAGRLTQAQGDALKQRVANGDGLPRFGRGPGTGMRGGGIVRAGLDVAAQYLGITEATLRSDLAAGQSLAQIASSTPDRSTEGLKAALLAAAKTRLDTAVNNGRITGAQEQTILNDLSTRIDSLLQRTWTGAGAGASMRPFHRFAGRARGSLSAHSLFGG